VADSKKLKLPNSSARKHPLTHLERGVLAFEASRTDRTGDGPVADDASLFAALGAFLPEEPWWGGEPVALPLGGRAAELRIASSVLARELSRAGAQVLHVGCRVMAVGEFNEAVRRGGKAATTEAVLREHLTLIRDRWANTGEHIRIACDRQGGRQDYTRALSGVYGGDIRTLEQSPRASVYAIGERLGVQLTPEAEERHLPVALASMTAKLVRELAMARFNRYFAARALSAGKIEPKPTAGYVQDARRWLAEMDGLLRGPERAALVRNA
jgi:hypothetical protein